MLSFLFVHGMPNRLIMQLHEYINKYINIYKVTNRLEDSGLFNIDRETIINKFCDINEANYENLIIKPTAKNYVKGTKDDIYKSDLKRFEAFKFRLENSIIKYIDGVIGNPTKKAKLVEYNDTLVMLKLVGRYMLKIPFLFEYKRVNSSIDLSKVVLKDGVARTNYFNDNYFSILYLIRSKVLATELDAKLLLVFCHNNINEIPISDCITRFKIANKPQLERYYNNRKKYFDAIIFNNTK